MLATFATPHQFPGRLFVVEGIDGSGKTTQLGLLAKWLVANGHRVFVTEWNSSALVKAATKTGKRDGALTPMTFSLLHATDFADRQLYRIIPPLKAGMIVLADRYAESRFVKLFPEGTLPDLHGVVYTNGCHLGVAASGHNTVVVSAIDNLVKGAAGQAVENLNLMLGLPVDTGLTR